MRWLTGLVACLALLLAPLAASAAPAPATASPLEPASMACASAAANGPPCGYIQPFVNIEVADKKPCRKADHSDCMKVPDMGQSVEFKAKFQYYWKLSEDLTYPPDAQQTLADPNTAIPITFSGVASNPKWLTFSVEPKSLAIASADLVNPTNTKLDQSGPNPVLYYWFERDITITLKHSGDPTPAEMDRLAAKGGTSILLVKAKTGANGAYFKEGFGTEDFRFDASSLLAPASSGKTSPSSGLLAGLGVLALAAAARRRA